MDSFYPLGVALKNRSKVKKWSEAIIKWFWKSGANVSSDLLVFDPRPIIQLYWKKAQIEQKVIIVFIESWKEIELWFWIIWIASWLFLISAIFREQIGVKVGSKTETLRSYCPRTHQNGYNEVLKHKNVVLLLSKVENKEYTETETWHREHVEQWSYYRLCENLW